MDVPEIVPGPWFCPVYMANTRPLARGRPRCGIGGSGRGLESSAALGTMDETHEAVINYPSDQGLQRKAGCWRNIRRAGSSGPATRSRSGAMRIKHTLFVLAFAAAAALPLSARAAEKLVTVTGQASVKVAPDTAVIRIGVTSHGKTAREASDTNAKKMTAVMNAIKQNGVAESDIQTSRLSLQPQYDSKGGANRLLGFQVTNQLTVKIHDIGRLPTLLDRAIASGANEMSGIEFVVSKRSKLLDQVRDEAVVDARRKAALYAKAAGAKLGRVVSITEEGAPTPPRPFATMRAGAGAVPVAPGEVTLRARVTVSYELAP
jgi:uncharacterized protein YggE